ncbi:hypothetical protein ACFQZE_06910 [Paenibacillus sp. GCM10027627]|uniref:hypothetical protein n=1 Tax=unclassified Paenibacillus TaxID=185978 RepID=UPI003643C843
MGRLSITQRIKKSNSIIRQVEIATEWHNTWGRKIENELNAVLEETKENDLSKVFNRINFCKIETDKYMNALPNVFNVIEVKFSRYQEVKVIYFNFFNEIAKKLNTVSSHDVLSDLENFFKKHIEFCVEIKSILKSR